MHAANSCSDPSMRPSPWLPIFFLAAAPSVVSRHADVPWRFIQNMNRVFAFAHMLGRLNVQPHLRWQFRPHARSCRWHPLLPPGFTHEDDGDAALICVLASCLMLGIPEDLVRAPEPHFGEFYQGTGRVGMCSGVSSYTWNDGLGGRHIPWKLFDT